MGFLEQYQQLKSLFNLNQDEIRLPGCSTQIRNMEFQSQFDLHATSAGQIADSHISENIRFRYPVFMPEGKTRINKAIIFLHGLNERSWHKHLAGAKFLSENTGMAVILFPLSYHINRGLPDWTDVRKMAGLLERRKHKYPGIREASLVNLALSERLTESPERFFISGLQSSMDLVSLIKEIRGGKHPLFEANTKTDLFAYSISCMLLQSLMISNPDNILSKSKIVFFAGGSLFSYMEGISKYIMDSVAFESIRKCYGDLLNKKPGFLKEFQPWILEHNFGKAFRALIAPEELTAQRESHLAEFKDNLLVIAMRDDKVMPVAGIRQAFGQKISRSKSFRIVHFPYPYIHENPFPVLYKKIEKQVEHAFHEVFNPTLQLYRR